MISFFFLLLLPFSLYSFFMFSSPSFSYDFQPVDSHHHRTRKRREQRYRRCCMDVVPLLQELICLASNILDCWFNSALHWRSPEWRSWWSETGVVLYRRSRCTCFELSIMINPPLLESLPFLFHSCSLAFFALTRHISMYAFVKIDASGQRWSLHFPFIFIFWRLALNLCRILRSRLE